VAPLIAGWWGVEDPYSYSGVGRESWHQLLRAHQHACSSCDCPNCQPRSSQLERYPQTQISTYPSTYLP